MMIRRDPVVRTDPAERRPSLATVQSHNSDFGALVCACLCQRRMREDGEVVASLAYVEARGQACKDLLYTRVDAPDSGWTLCSESKGTKTYCQVGGAGTTCRKAALTMGRLIMMRS